MSTPINVLLRGHLGSGRAVALATATSATIVIGDDEQQLDLSAKAGRLLAESAAVVHAQVAGQAQVVNLG
ncbi:hypothetical protein [Actinoplanes cyaneus]|nr:hypothetical protein [Actinoplanes cyaneus]MCW2138842.1 hypothetical protein [Actinoplanes cyaneus]